MSKEEFLNYIIDFATDTDEDSEKNRRIKRLVYCMVLYFWSRCRYKRIFRAAFEMIEEFENYMVELIV